MTNEENKHNCQVFHFDLFGTREEKYDYLNQHNLSDVPWEELNPQEPQMFFVPKDFSLHEEYEKGFMIGELMHLSSSGVKTHHDKELVSTTPFNSENNKPYTYRPFDNQWIDYDLNKVVRHRYKYMRHLLKDNISLIIGPQGQAVGEMPWNILFVSKHLVDTNIFYRGGGIVFPLYLYQETLGVEERVPNLNPQIVRQIEQSLGEAVEPQELFDYIYAVLHSPGYRERYKEFLKIDFPRIPYPTDGEKYRDLVALGKELRQLHLMENLPHSTGVSFPVGGTLQVDCYRWQQKRVYINAEQYFEGVPESAWNFYIGGYQPAQKWLKDRKGMTLTFEDVKHYQRIIYVLRQTERIMTEIDNILPKS